MWYLQKSNGRILEVRMLAALFRLTRDESGATAVEYGLIAALIIVICIAAIQVVGTQLNTTFGTIAGALATTNG
jgi:pilus assembly protein Flp/PilA